MDLPVWELPDSLPYEIELIHLILAWEHGLAVDELANDAAESPHIGGFSIAVADQELGTPVPPGCDILGEVFVGLGHEAGKPKVAKLQDIRIVVQ